MPSNRPHPPSHQRSEDQTAELVLFLAGELPEARRSELQRRIDADSDVRAELAAMQSAWDSTSLRLESADEAERIAARARAAERQVARALAQWKVDRLARGGVAASSGPTATFRRFPIWMYPLSAAATVLLVLGVWSLVLQEPDYVGPIADADHVAREPSEDADRIDAAVAALTWNPLSDIGGDSLASLEHEYDRFRQFMETQQPTSADASPALR